MLTCMHKSGTQGLSRMLLHETPDVLAIRCSWQVVPRVSLPTREGLQHAGYLPNGFEIGSSLLPHWVPTGHSAVGRTTSTYVILCCNSTICAFKPDLDSYMDLWRVCLATGAVPSRDPCTAPALLSLAAKLATMDSLQLNMLYRCAVIITQHRDTTSSLDVYLFRLSKRCTREPRSETSRQHRFEVPYTITTSKDSNKCKLVHYLL